MLRSSALVCSILWTGAAHAATISIEPAGADKPVVVIVQGAFNPKDGDHFFTKTRPLSAATVRLQSDGGSLLAGVQIGETIRLKGFQTVVLENARCASACAMAWLGGTQRFMGRGAQIGWHAANSQQGSGVPNALIGAYLNRVGLPYSAVVYLTQTAPQSVAWLSIDDAKRLGIEVSPLDAAERAPDVLPPPSPRATSSKSAVPTIWQVP